MLGKNINNKFVVDDMIFLTEEQYKKYEKSEKVGIKNITLDLLYDFLNNDYFYNYILDLFNEKIQNLLIIYVDINGNRNLNKYYKMDILKALSEAILNDKLFLDENTKGRFEALTNNISYESFRKKYLDEDYSCMIDGEKIIIPVSLMIAFLECSLEEYNKFFNLENNDKIIGIPKEYFIYALIKFFKSNKILDKYYIPENLIERYKELLNSRKIDLQSINRINKIHNINSESIVLNLELENEVLDSIPSDLTKLEKAIFVYLKLCDILTYDEEFYALNSQGNINKKHEDIKRLKSVSLKNNNVICYEFNAIYSKLLEKISVNYETNASFSDIFCGGHEDLTFKCGKYLIKADSTITTILYSDIVNVKLGKSLNGLICLNVNANTQKEFKEKLSRIYKKYLDIREKKLNKSLNFQKLELKYKEIRHDNNIEVSKKFEYLIKEIEHSNLLGIDAMSYVHQLTKLIFNDEELENNINFTILKCNSNTINLCGIFVFNKIYYLYIPNKVFAKLSKEIIENLFDQKNLEYIDLHHLIPGIEQKKEVMSLIKK